MSRKSYLLSLILLIVALLYGCGLILPPLNPITNDHRLVNNTADPGKQVVFKESIVWYDGYRKTKGILFPDGIYIIEAEDDEYYYFKAPKELECRDFKNGQTTDIQFRSGGLCLTKKVFNLVPAGAYFSVSEDKKIITWKLGSDFMRLENDKWKKLY